MIAEVNAAKEFLQKKFGSLEPEAIPVGLYAVPYDTSKGPAFMQVRFDGKHLSGFDLFMDESCTQSWHDVPRDPERDYFMQEMRLTPEQLERSWQFYKEHRRCLNGDTVTPSHNFTIEWQFSSIGTCKVMTVNGKTLWIDEEECNP